MANACRLQYPNPPRMPENASQKSREHLSVINAPPSMLRKTMCQAWLCRGSPWRNMRDCTQTSTSPDFAQVHILFIMHPHQQAFPFRQVSRSP